MPAFIDLTGYKFGYLTVIRPTRKNKKGNYCWLCLCRCGKETEVSGSNLRDNHTKSCGCSHIKHRLSNTKIYGIWKSMIQRCEDINNPAYGDYGNRGISVCERWLNKENGLQNFYNDIGNIPKGLTLDRINNNGNYDPNNWKLSTRKEQARNRRSNINIPYGDGFICLKDYCKIKKLNYGTVLTRINRYGWSIEDAITITVQHRRKKNNA